MSKSVDNNVSARSQVKYTHPSIGIKIITPMRVITSPDIIEGEGLSVSILVFIDIKKILIFQTICLY